MSNEITEPEAPRRNTSPGRHLYETPYIDYFNEVESKLVKYSDEKRYSILTADGRGLSRAEINKDIAKYLASILITFDFRQVNAMTPGTQRERIKRSFEYYNYNSDFIYTHFNLRTGSKTDKLILISDFHSSKLQFPIVPEPDTIYIFHSFDVDEESRRNGHTDHTIYITFGKYLVGEAERKKAMKEQLKVESIDIPFDRFVIPGSRTYALNHLTRHERDARASFNGALNLLE